MTALIDLLSSHQLLGWMALGGVLLIAEMMTGSGWLLWPAGSAAAVGVLCLAPGVGLPAQAAVFAGLTVISTLVGRRFLGPRAAHGHDLNDSRSRLIGKEGKAATAFEAGRGRVFVDGKEWSAELDGAETLAVGGRIHVIDLMGGARLKVRPG